MHPRPALSHNPIQPFAHCNACYHHELSSANPPTLRLWHAFCYVDGRDDNRRAKTRGFGPRGQGCAALRRLTPARSVRAAERSTGPRRRAGTAAAASAAAGRRHPRRGHHHADMRGHKRLHVQPDRIRWRSGDTVDLRAGRSRCRRLRYRLPCRAGLDDARLPAGRVRLASLARWPRGASSREGTRLRQMARRNIVNERGQCPQKGG